MKLDLPTPLSMYTLKKLSEATCTTSSAKESLRCQPTKRPEPDRSITTIVDWLRLDSVTSLKKKH